MPCPICNQPPKDTDHRVCLFELFKSNTIKSVSDWETMCKPKTIMKGRIRALIMKESPEVPSS